MHDFDSFFNEGVEICEKSRKENIDSRDYFPGDGLISSIWLEVYNYLLFRHLIYN